MRDQGEERGDCVITTSFLIPHYSLSRFQKAGENPAGLARLGAYLRPFGGVPLKVRVVAVAFDQEARSFGEAGDNGGAEVLIRVEASRPP